MLTMSSHPIDCHVERTTHSWVAPLRRELKSYKDINVTSFSPRRAEGHYNVLHPLLSSPVCSAVADGERAKKKKIPDELEPKN